MATPKRKKRVRWVILALLLLGAGGGGAWYYFHRKPPVITVQTEKVTRRDITELVVANGRIQPVIQVVISPEVAGEIVALPVKEGQEVKKGDLLVQIKPDNYKASCQIAEASYQSAIASKSVAQAEFEKALAEFKRHEQLFKSQLESENIFLDFKTMYEVAKLHCDNALHQVDQAKYGLDKARDDLSKTTITSPIDGSVTRLKSQLGERVLGTSFNMGTEIMTVAQLANMEARVDIGEIDVVLIAVGQKARLEVDAFKDRKFHGIVTEIANSSKGLGQPGMGGGGGGGGQQQEATKFEVKIGVEEKELFRPGMSVGAEIETRYRTNVLSVPFASVTTRLPKPPAKDGGAATNAPSTNSSVKASGGKSGGGKEVRKNGEPPKPLEVVFVTEGDHVRVAPVKRGINDDSYVEIIEGLREKQEVVSGGYKAISRELEDGKKVKIGPPKMDKDKEKEKENR